MTRTINHILKNFEKLAEENKRLADDANSLRDELGVRHVRSAVLGGNTLSLTAEQAEVLQEKKHPFGVETEDIVDKAHPEPAHMGDGQHTSGVVDNLNEQHQKILNMVNKRPTGNVFHDMRLAAFVSGLIKIADEFDDAGLIKEADELDQVISELTGSKKKSITKEALPFLIPFLGALGWKGIAAVAVGVGALGLGWNAALGFEEGLIEDAQDLIENIEDWKDDEEYRPARSKVNRLWSNANKLHEFAKIIIRNSSSTNPTKANVENLGLAMKNFEKALIEVENDLGYIKGAFPGLLGISFPLTEGKVRDLRGSWKNIVNSLKSAQPKVRDKILEVSKSMDKGAPQGDNEKGLATPAPAEKVPASQRIKEIQQFLKSNVDSSLWVTGIMDDKTRSALDSFAEKVSVEIGVSNLDGVRLEEEATGKSLRRILDIYKHPWKYAD